VRANPRLLSSRYKTDPLTILEDTKGLDANMRRNLEAVKAMGYADMEAMDADLLGRPVAMDKPKLTIVIIAKSMFLKLHEEGPDEMNQLCDPFYKKFYGTLRTVMKGKRAGFFMFLGEFINPVQLKLDLASKKLVTQRDLFLKEMIGTGTPVEIKAFGGPENESYYYDGRIDTASPDLGGIMDDIDTEASNIRDADRDAADTIHQESDRLERKHKAK
jgi:hypothetical protein